MTEREIFLEALEMPTPEARAGYLQGACGRDGTLRRKVDELLLEHYSNDSLLAGPAQEELRTVQVQSPVPDASAQMLGRYKLLEKIGEGGFGEVWMAEQREPVKRRVALKLIKLGMDSRTIVARFEAERQALAMMDHANIAKIFDADVTDTGRPYFVMELVRGIKITEYCDQNQLPTKERLALFIKVCQAIQHAHQKGIIHRDIKPSNILVTLHDGVPVPKVIDFGIAKATQQELTDKTVFTQFQQFIGTPAYISPEQAEMSGLDIDTRADIYSLGVLLYELLVGQTPFDAKEMMQGGLEALRQIIREKEPLRPSTKLSQTLAAADMSQRKSTQGLAIPTPEEVGADSRRRLRLKEQIAVVRGDLDWIVMKCLEKDRTRRYDTANGLAMDIQRYLANEPIVARPPSTGYRMQKAFRRNKLVFSAGLAVVLTLVAGLSLAAIGWRQTRVERDKALQAQAGEEMQRRAAQASAVTAQEQRRLAEEREQTGRRYLYAAQINRAQQSWKDGNIARALDLLSSQRPTPGEEDQRGFEWRYLWRLCQDESVFTFRGHSSSVQSLAVSPDGKTLASASGDSTVKLWDVLLRRDTATLLAKGELRSVAFSPDGRTVAAGGYSGQIKLWNLESRQELATLTELSGRIENLAFSWDGRSLVAGRTGDGKMAVWDVATRKLRISLPGAPNDRPWMAFSPDGKTMASTSGDKTVRLWDTATWREVAALAGHDGEVVCVAFSPDSKTLASSSTDTVIKLWDAASRRELVTLPVHRSWVTSVTFSPDGTMLATTCVDGTVKLWNLDTKQEVATLKGHTAWVNKSAFLPDSQMLASASDDKTVKIWKTTPPPSSDVLGKHAAQINDGAFSHSGRFLATASEDGSVKLWDLAAQREAATLPHMAAVKSVAFSPDDQRLVSASDDGNVTLWDLETQHAFAILKGHTARADAATFSPDGKTVASGGGDKTIRLWNVAAKSELMILRGHAERVSSLGFSPDGKILASTDSGGTIRLWDVVSDPNQEIATFPGPVGHQRLFFSPDGHTLVSSGYGGSTAQLWNVPQRRLLANLTGHTDEIISGALSTDGETYATCSADHTARLWDGASGKQRAVLRGHAGWVISVAFSPDGKTVATAGNDSTVRLWNPRNEQEIAILPGGITGIFSRLMFSPDGNLLVGYGQEMLVRAWRAAPLAEADAGSPK